MAGQRDFAVKIEGVRELTQAMARIDPALRKELGQRNKGIGQEVINRATPKPIPVGAGKGATPRPSASANVLRIVAGGAHRARVGHVAQWGARYAPRNNERPYLLGAAQQQMPEIEKEYLEALATVARKAGFTFR